MEPKQYKKIQSETKDTLIKMKSNLHRINSRVDEAENQISDLECKEAKTNKQTKTNKRVRIKKNPKNKGSVRNLWDNFNHTNIHIWKQKRNSKNWKPVWKK